MAESAAVREHPNYQLSGLLAQDSNTYKGISLKYSEPPEARVPPPDDKWRIYVFKNDEQIDVIHLGRQSAYLFGREKAVVDMMIEHPSCSKQHAVIQFRQVMLNSSSKSNGFALSAEERARTIIKPYIIDLGSANGTKVNGQRIKDSRYYEILHKDCIQFAESTREYVFINHKGKD